jgi:phytoene dehydrogenase-like protein
VPQPTRSARGERTRDALRRANLDPTATFTQLLDRSDLPEAFASRVDAIDHRAAYFQIHFALNGLPEFISPNGFSIAVDSAET